MTRTFRILLVLSPLLSMMFAASTCQAQFTIMTIQDLQSMQNNLGGSYVLGADIDASATATWNGGTGFIPIGNANNGPFTGTFDGQGHTIAGLTINSNLTYVGLFGYIGSTATIKNVTLAGVLVTSIGSGGYVGTLVGRMGPGTVVDHASAQGTVQAANGAHVGGLVGYSQASISYGSAAVTVTSTSNGGEIGGLVGGSGANNYFQTIYSYGSVTNSQASGSVSGMSSGTTQAWIGGLIGRNSISTLSNSRATGNVKGTATSLVGGLVGQDAGWLIACIEDYCNNGNVLQAVGITYSFATGSVTTGAGGTAGGLIGDAFDSYVYQDFATGNVTNSDGGGKEGGLIGTNEGGNVSDSYATGNVVDNTGLAIGGLIGENEYYYYASKWQITPIIDYTYSIGAVVGEYPKYAGGLVGQDTTGRGSICSYWATDTSLQSTSADGTGLLLSQLESGTSTGCFDATIWATTSGTLPNLISNPSPVHGYINPKYQVVGVTYAPPGPSSSTFVQYTNGSSVGTSQTISQSFKNSNTVNVNVTASYDGSKADPMVDFKGSVELGYSQMSSQTVKNSTTISTSFQVQEGEKTSGTANYFFPVNHDYDVIWIWLNPTVILTVYPPGVAGTNAAGYVEWNGYGFDSHDQSDVDVIGIPLGYLNGDFGPIPPQYQTSLARAWAAAQTYGPGQSAALTSAELAQIASADPFSVSSYGLNYITYTPPSPNTSDNRFTLSTCTGQSGIPYVQANPSQSAETYTCSLTNSNSSSRTKDVTNEYSQTYSIDLKAGANFGLKAFSFDTEFKDSYTLTWTTEDQASSSSSSTTSASLSVQGPPCNNTIAGFGPCSPVYDTNGQQPTQFYVYQDNLYGTFMFAPVNYYTSTLNTVVSTPIFSPFAGTYATKQIVTITDSTPTATIFYTTNGTTPTTASAIYSGPVTVATNETLQALAVAADLSNSTIASAAYVITNPQTATAPVFDPPGGTYSGAQTVSLSDSIGGASIYYTTDGTMPTMSSMLYSTPILVNSTETIEAIAVAPGYANSPVTVASFTISAPPVAAAPTFSVAPGSYSSSLAVVLFDSAPNATIYYTTNGSTPTMGSAVYSSPILITSSETLKAIAVAPGYMQSATASAVYVITPGGATVAPTFGVAPGTYLSSQQVAISDSAPNVTIYYTTNGDTPTTSSAVYSAPIIVAITETLKAIAVAPGQTPSQVASAAYTITGPGPTFQMSASPSAMTIKLGQSGSTVISMTALNGFNNAVTLACSGLSAGMGCTFSPASMTPTGTATTSTVTITTTAAATARLDRGSDRSVIYCATVLPSSLLLLLLTGAKRRNSLRRSILALVVLCACALGISSCASGSNNKIVFGSETPIGTSVVTVMGVTGGPNAANQTLSLAVTVTK